MRFVATAALVASAALCVPLMQAPAADAHGRCRGISWVYTVADIHAERLSCHDARRVAAGYRNRMDDYCDRFGCSVIYVLRFRCVWHSHRYYLTVDCRRGERKVHISWGD
jgi:hypothetical protein